MSFFQYLRLSTRATGFGLTSRPAASSTTGANKPTLRASGNHLGELIMSGSIEVHWDGLVNITCSVIDLRYAKVTPALTTSASENKLSSALSRSKESNVFHIR